MTTERMTPGYRLGVVDLGSNTSTLALYQVGLDGFVDRIHQRGEPLRLIRQLGGDRMFPIAAMDRVVQLVRGFVRTGKEWGVEQLLVVATAAVRDARNGQDLLERLRGEGCMVQLLSAEEEGLGAVTAAVNTLPVERGYLFDLGGGSIQIALFEDRKVLRAASLPLGALRLSDQFMSSDPPTGPQITALRRHVDVALREVPWFQAGPGLELVGVGGTARAIGKLDRRTRQWPIVHGHGYPLSLDAVEAIFEETSRLPMAVRKMLPGLADHRVDVVVAGAQIVQRVMRRAGFEGLRLCHYGVREGMALRRVHGVEQPLVPNVREAGLHGRFPEDPARRTLEEAAGRQVGSLFDTLGGPASLRWLLVAAARLAAAGGRWPDEPHTSALLSTPLPGFYQEEVLVLVDLLSPAVGPPRAMDWDDRDRLRLLLELAVDLGAEGRWSRKEAAITLDTTTFRRLSGGYLRRFEKVFGVELRKA